MELAEAIDSVSWKHWKNIDWGIDYENFKVELIDIWHFLMSELLIHMQIEEIVDIFIDKSSIEARIKLPREWTKDDNSNIDDIIEPYENLMVLSLVKIDKRDYLSDLIEAFCICMNSAWVDIDDLYKLYIWKNVLNKFRQDHGYKEWTYIKVWNGEEDNVVMQRIIADTIWFEGIYHKLEKEYSKL